MQPNIAKLKKLVASKKHIDIYTAFIKETLGFDDMRDFAESLHSWAHTTDFTYREHETSNFQHFIRRYIKDTFLD